MLILIAVAAVAAPVDDAVRLFTVGEHTCLERDNGEVACWGGELDRATPRSDIPSRYDGTTCRAEGQQLVCGEASWSWPTRLEKVVGHCGLGEGEVHCVGAAWRYRAGMPPGTPTDVPIRAPSMSGATDLGPGPCILRDGDWLCLHEGQVTPRKGFPPLGALLSESCAHDLDGTIWCGTPPREVVKKGLDAAQSSERAIARDATGQVLSQVGRPGTSTPWTPVDVPLLQASGPGTVVVGDHHSCALAPGGRVACWGSDADNGLGDGDGRRRRFVEAEEAIDRGDVSLSCALTDGAVTCDGLAPWADRSNHWSPALAPLRLEGVEKLALGPGLGCAITTSADLYCFGWLGEQLLQADAPLLGGVAEVDVLYGLSALGLDGQLHRWSEWGAHRRAGSLQGAQQVLHSEESGLSCLVSDRGLMCVDDQGPVTVERPDGDLDRGPWGQICVEGTQRCLEDSIFADGSRSTEVVYVEAGW